MPLRIPASTYNLDTYIKSLLKDENELSGDLARVVSALLDEPTPVSIKRYINTVYLYRNIFGGTEDAGPGSLAMLLAAVILGIESADGFDAVASCAHGDKAHFDEELAVALDSLGTDGGVDWNMLPTLWQGGEGAADEANRSAFISWIRKLR